PAVVSPSVHSVRPGQTYVTVQTLTKENLVIVVNQKTKVHDVLWKCGEILEITEDKLFGLAVRQPTEGIVWPERVLGKSDTVRKEFSGNFAQNTRKTSCKRWRRPKNVIKTGVTYSTPGFLNNA
ncbi:hypothetical protein ANCDUO_16704, partial [Ancylostoma duodenale]